MTFALVLLTLFFVLQLPWLRRRPGLRTQRDRAAVAAGLFFVAAGALHFLSPARYLVMIPPALPAPMLWVVLSGAGEAACGVGLLRRSTRRTAAWCTVALLFAILPANVHVALSGQAIEGLPSAGWYYMARIPFQLVYVAWVVWAGGLLRRSRTGEAAAEPGTSNEFRRPRTSSSP